MEEKKRRSLLSPVWKQSCWVCFWDGQQVRDCGREGWNSFCSKMMWKGLPSAHPKGPKGKGLELWLGHMLVWQHPVSWNYHVFNCSTVLTFRNFFNSGHEGLPWRSWDWILWYHPPLGWPPTASPQSNPSSPLQVSESLFIKTIKNIVCVKLSAVQSVGQLAFCRRQGGTLYPHQV